MVWDAPPDIPGGDHLHLRQSVVSSPPWNGHADHLAIGCGSLAPLALELASVCVHAVIPGPIDSMRIDTAYGAERDTIVQNRGAILPGRRVGTADNVVQVILRLITNDYLTGKVVHVSGGGQFV